MSNKKIDTGPDCELGNIPSQPGEVRDAVFGNVGEEGPNFRNVGWLGTVVLMMKTQIGLGVLSIPKAFDSLGLIPGLIVMLVIAVITTWSDYMVGHFKMKHPEVYGIDDAGGMMFGITGKEVLATAYCLYWIFVAGSGMLGISIGLNSLSTHGTCTAVFVAVAAIVGFAASSIRTLGKVSWLAWIGLACILIAIFAVTIAAGVQETPAAAPSDGPWTSDYQLFRSPNYAEAMSAVSSLVFAYCGTPAFFAIASEMRDPQYYTRSLLICQGSVTCVYLVIGIIVYYFCGSYVASPALGSAGVLMKKVSYGFALPGLIVTTALALHLTAKYIFVRVLRGSEHLSKNTWVHWVTWIGTTFGVTVISYCIASGIPVFDSLVSLIGALLGTLMAFQPMGCMWLYDNWKKPERDLKWMLMACWSCFVVVAGTYLTVAGTYGSVVAIKTSYDEAGGSGAWSCADNSNSV